MKIMASNPITSWQVDGEKLETVTDFIFLGSKITADGDRIHEIKRCLLFGRKAMTNLESTLKQKYRFANEGLYDQNYDFSASHVWVWVLDHKEGWALKNWCFWTMVLKKTREILYALRYFSDSKEIKPVNLKGNQPWIFTEKIIPEFSRCLDQLWSFLYLPCYKLSNT